MTLEEIVNSLKSAGQDYGQLFNNNSRMDATKQFGGRAINNINSAGEGYSQWQRLQDQNFGPNQSVIASGFMHPQKGLSKLADWFTNNVNTAAGLPDPNQQDEASMYAYGPNIDQQAESGLNLAGLLQTGAFASGAAPKSAGGTLGTFIANPIESNLNADLLKKYLSTGKLSPKEMAQYEANGLAMETPQLQRYNLGNAMANPERNAHMGSYDVYPYHGTNDVITAPDYAFSGKGADQLGSAAIYTSKQPSLASGFTNPDISGGNVLPLALKNTNKYMSDELKKKLTPAQLREFITKSPDEYALSNFGDVGYEGKNKVINTAVQGYHQYGDEKLLDTLNSLNNDFYRGNPEEFNKLAGKLTKKAGVVMDTGENKIYAPWNTKDIRSRFAAFDPLRKNSSSLLASGLLGALLFNNENKTSENK
jgi:hypothetical protein